MSPERRGLSYFARIAALQWPIRLEEGKGGAWRKRHLRNDQSSTPVFMAALGVSMFSCMDALLKKPTIIFPLGEVVELRYATGAIFAVIAFLLAGERSPAWGAVRRNASRAVVMLAMTACLFIALARLPLAECVALTFMAPLFLSLMGWIILKEPISPKAMVGVVLGLGGVVIIALGGSMRGGNAFDLIGLCGALACALLYALSNILMRQQASRDSLHTIVLLSNCSAALFCVPFAALHWRQPSAVELTFLTLAGFFGTCAHFCMAWAYARAQAGRLGILEYSAFLWASILGFVFFGEVPTATTIAGAALILVACLGTTGAVRFGFWPRRRRS
jgi:drug/metabolite transporter (DMT)-like permease